MRSVKRRDDSNKHTIKKQTASIHIHIPDTSDIDKDKRRWREIQTEMIESLLDLGKKNLN